VNVIGGLTADEPAADLAVILSLSSSYLDVPVGDKLVAIGEVGLTGELRAVTNLEQRLNEARRLGFTEAIVPSRGRGKTPLPSGLRLIEVNNIRDALRQLGDKK
jgi:DNA repair protein RadA/Sms